MNEDEVYCEIKNDGDIVKIDKDMVFNPYNNLNNEITLSNVQCILSKYGLPKIVHNMELYKRSFVHQSYTKRPNFENIAQNITIVEQPSDCLALKSKSNENLEFLGDGVLELIVKYHIYRRFPKENEGFKTEKKIEIVKNETIGRFAYEMGLHKWLILSKHAEEKGTRTKLKKLGCLFEAFLGALFLDMNKIVINDEHKWFDLLFSTGPGFQMAQVFVDNILDQHIDWTKLIQTDDNYKKQLQIIIQKEFKVTPHYLEIETYNQESGYYMGVYLCLGQPIHAVNFINSIESFNIEQFNSFQSIHEYVINHQKILLCMGKSSHRIKQKAEQAACNNALIAMDNLNIK